MTLNHKNITKKFPRKKNNVRVLMKDKSSLELLYENHGKGERDTNGFYQGNRTIAVSMCYIYF